MEVNYLDLVGEGYMGSMQWQLGREMGTILAFASRTQENHENLGRGGKKNFLNPIRSRTGEPWVVGLSSYPLDHEVLVRPRSSCFEKY